MKNLEDSNLRFQPDVSLTQKSVLRFKSPKSCKVEVIKEGFKFENKPITKKIMPLIQKDQTV